LTYIFVADNMGLRSLVSRNYASKSNPLNLKLLGHSFCNQSQANKG